MDTVELIDRATPEPVLVIGSLPPGGRDLDLLVHPAAERALAEALRANGFHAQAGFFLVRDRLEVAGRYAAYDPSSLLPGNDRKETGGVVNYYLSKHNLKLQADFRRLEDDSRNQKTKELRIQTQVVF